MIEYLRSLASTYLARWRGGEPPFEDPFIAVREPRPHGPGGNHLAASVGEPLDDLFVRAAGASASPSVRAGRIES